MRIAVALSGQPRTWRWTIGTLRRFFEGHEVAYFLHTWDETPAEEIEALMEAYGPQGASVEARPAFIAEKQDLASQFPQKPPLTVFDMVHSVAASLELALAAHEDTPFDLICRARFDLVFDGVWTPTPLADDEVSTPPYADGPSGCNDQFALGRPAAMRAYAGVATWLPQNLTSVPGPRFRPEEALLTYLTKGAGLRVVQTAYAARLLREGQEGRAFADLRDDPMFHAEKHEDWEAFARRHFAPSVVEQADFTHDSRLAVRLLRDIDRWLGAQTEATRAQLLTAPWAKRIDALDIFLGAQVAWPLDSGAYGKLRYLCATLLHRMEQSEPMTTEAFIVHALSANRLDTHRAAGWLAEDATRLSEAARRLQGLKTFAAMFEFGDPFKQPAGVYWRLA